MIPSRDMKAKKGTSNLLAQYSTFQPSLKPISPTIKLESLIITDFKPVKLVLSQLAQNLSQQAENLSQLMQKLSQLIEKLSQIGLIFKEFKPVKLDQIYLAQIISQLMQKLSQSERKPDFGQGIFDPLTRNFSLDSSEN